MNTLAFRKVAKFVCGNKVTTINCPQLTGFEKESEARDIAAMAFIKTWSRSEYDIDVIRPMIRFDWEPQANMLLN